MSEYTKGPLYVFRLQDHRYLPGDHGIFHAGGMVGVGNKANARLWAASVDLLEACKAVLFPAGDTAEQIQAQLLAAIQKAESES